MRTIRTLVSSLAALFVFLAGITSLQASTVYWNVPITASGWDNTANWSTVASGTSGFAPVSVPGSGDTVIIGSTLCNSLTSINLNANQSVLGIQYGGNGPIAAGVINSGAGTNTLTIGTGGITDAIGAGSITINAGIVVNGNQTWTAAGSAGVIISGTVTGTGNLTLTNFTAQATSYFNHTGNLSITGGSYYSTSAAYTGALTISGGEIYNTAIITGASGGSTFNGGTIGGHGTLIISSSVSQVGTTNWYNNGGNTTFSGSFTGGPSGNGVFNDIGTGGLTLSGNTDNTNLSVQTPTGTTYLDKTSSATVHAIGKALNVQTGSLAQIIGTGGYQLSGSAVVTVSGTFDFNGASESFDQLAGTSAAGTVTNTLASSTSTLTIGGNNGSSSFSGAIQNGASGTGVVAVNKNGTGTLTLAGLNTYTGATNINAGTLSLTGTIGSTGGTAITVASGASLTEGALGAIVGTSSLTLNSGTTTLNGLNTYSGATNVKAGTILVDNSALTTTNSGTVSPGSSLSASSTVTLNGSTLKVSGHTSTVAQTLNVTWINAGQFSMASTAGLTPG